MKTTYEYKSYWFLPDFPDNKVAGTLHYTPNKIIRLELIGGFKGHPSGFLADDEVEVIHGITSTAKKITLFNCDRRESKHYDVDFPIANYYLQFVFENIHLLNIDEPIFNEVRFQMPLLDTWTDMHVIENDWSCNKDDNFTNIALTYDDKNAISIKEQISENTEIKITSLCNISDIKPMTSCITMKQETYCDIISKIPASNEDLYKQAQIFRHFLSLATKAPIDFERIIFYGDTIYNEDKNGNKTLIPIPFYYIQEEVESINRQYSPLFRYRNVK